MKVFVKVKPGAKHERFSTLGENRFEIFVKEPAKDGKANFAVAKALAKHFGVPISQISLKFGAASRQKTFEII